MPSYFSYCLKTEIGILQHYLRIYPFKSYSVIYCIGFMTHLHTEGGAGEQRERSGIAELGSIS
jgi:hypothetical protein